MTDRGRIAAKAQRIAAQAQILEFIAGVFIGIVHVIAVGDVRRGVEQAGPLHGTGAGGEQRMGRGRQLLTWRQRRQAPACRAGYGDRQPAGIAIEYASAVIQFDRKRSLGAKYALKLGMVCYSVLFPGFWREWVLLRRR